MRRSLLGVVVAVTLSVGAVVPAIAKRFGANLHRSANYGLDCSKVFAFGAPPPYNFAPTGGNTCTWFSSGDGIGDTRESMIVPSGKGVITRVRVKVGPHTGPMRVVVLHTVNGPVTACCKAIAQSRVFTPRRNRITTIRVHLRVENLRTRFKHGVLLYADFDTIALSVLRGGVPVPAHDTGDYSNGPIAGFYVPAIRLHQERAAPGGYRGLMPLLNADWKRRR